MESSEEDDERVQYVKQDLLFQHNHQQQQPYGEYHEDNRSTTDSRSSNHYFMSEPSMSEVDSQEITSRSLLLSPSSIHHNDEHDYHDNDDNHFNRTFSSTTTSDDQDLSNDNLLPPPPPPPAARVLNTNNYGPPSSPGNTSLSSWESPQHSLNFNNKRVHIHFTPERTLKKNTTTSNTLKVPGRTGLSPYRNNNNNNNSFKTPDRGGGNGGQSSNSTSPASSQVLYQERLETFLEGLKVQSHINNAPMPALAVSGGDRARLSSMDTMIVQNTNQQQQQQGSAGLVMPILSNHTTISSQQQQQRKNTTTIQTDDTINMVLSASEDEEEDTGFDADTNTDSSLTLDWEQQQLQQVQSHLADDERTDAEKEPQIVRRIRTKTTNGSSGGNHGTGNYTTTTANTQGGGHRRQRSGDVAAATLSTGSKEWKGMEQDNIPLPPVVGSHDDDDEDESRRGIEEGDVALASKFAMGTAGDDEHHYRLSRKSRRQRRSSRKKVVEQTAALEESSSHASISPRATFASQKSASLNAMQSKKAQTGHTRSATHSGEDLHNPAYHHHHPPRSFESYEQPQISPQWNGPNWNPNFMQNYSFYQISPNSIDGSSARRRESLESAETPFSNDSSHKESPMNMGRSSLDFPDATSPEASSFLSDPFPFRTQDEPQEKTSSPFKNIGKVVEKADLGRFLPRTTENEHSYPTYLCPSCKTRQREFFTVSSAPQQFESAGGYITLYFGIYVVASLYIFGLQEGWGKLDCIYFAVITLTTAGLGDFVPTSDGAKVICSIFIYFGVACIGLLLGSYIAGMLDERSRKLAKENRIKSCPNCARIQNIKDAAERRARAYHRNSYRFRQHFPTERTPYERSSKKMKREHSPTSKPFNMAQSERPASAAAFDMSSSSKKGGMKDHKSPTFASTSKEEVSPDIRETISPTTASSPPATSEIKETNTNPSLLGSPFTNQILGRQSHTRHASLDIGFAAAFGSAARSRRFSADLPTTVEEASDTVSQAPYWTPPVYTTNANATDGGYDHDEEDDSESSDSEESTSSEESAVSLQNKYSAVKNTKYVFLTLREALLNSMVIIAFGCMGFYFIEGFSFIDSKFLATFRLVK